MCWAFTRYFDKIEWIASLCFSNWGVAKRSRPSLSIGIAKRRVGTVGLRPGAARDANFSVDVAFPSSAVTRRR
jgi:hypothetical protein